MSDSNKQQSSSQKRKKTPQIEKEEDKDYKSEFAG